MKDWINLSFKLSQAGGLFIGYVVTTAQADGGGTVECRANQFPTINQKQRFALETKHIDLGKVLLPPRTWQQELKIPERYASTIQAQRHDYNGKVLSIRAEDLKSLAIIYDMSPDELTSRLIEWGVLSPGMEGIASMGGDEMDDELDPHWERRRSPR